MARGSAATGPAAKSRRGRIDTRREQPRASVLVVVAVVGGVPVSVVDVVDVVAVRNRDMTATFTVNVVVGGVFGVRLGFAFVEVTFVLAVQMAVVDVVHMVAVRNRDMTAIRTVHMRMVGVLSVCRRHRCSLFPRSFLEAVVFLKVVSWTTPTITSPSAHVCS
jgi:hypothetical protein